MSTFINKKKSAKSNSEPSSNDSSPPASVNLTNGNNMYQVANNNNLNAANNNNNNAPKYGTLVPNRVFVGGISSTTTETELCQLFSKYGNVKATKIIADRAGVSKGYGFVTFETDEEAKRLQLDADNIILKERRLNIAPAIIKQAFPPRGFETTASPPPLAPNIQYLNGVPYTYQNGMAFFLPPQSQAAPIPAAPEAMFQGAGYHTQGPSPTYAAPMLYPVSNPAPMFLSPQHFAQFQQVPVTNQATQVMYAPAGLNTSLQTSNNGAEASSPLQIPSHAPPPFFLTQGEMRPELFYNMASGPQTYPFNAQMMMAVHESQFQYCDISTDQQPNSNASNEVMPQPIAEEHLAPQPPTEPSPTAAVAPENSEHPQRPRIDSETPIVSFRNLQKVDDGDCNRGARYNRNNSSRQGQNRSMHQNVAPKMVGQGDTNGNDRGTWPQRGRGRGSSIKSIPEFPYNNNNPNFVNNNNYKTANDTQGRGGYRGGSRGGNYRHNHNHNGRRVITRSSTPSPNDNSLPNPNALPHSNQFQVGQQQQFIQGRNMQLPYHAHHPGVATGGGNSMQHVHAHGYAHPHQPQQPQQQHHHQHQSSVPPRRVPNASNRRINHNNNSHQSSSRKRGDIDNGAAGDAPANLMTPPATPSITVTATDQEALCSGVKQINIQ